MWPWQGRAQRGPPWPGKVKIICMSCIVSLPASPGHRDLPLAKSTEGVGEENKELCLAPEPLERQFMNYCSAETNRAGGTHFVLHKASF